MSYGDYQNSIKLFNSYLLTQTDTLKNTDEKNQSEINLFVSSQANTDITTKDTDTASNEQNNIKNEIDINKLAKEYKENPADIITKLESMGIQFSNEQKAVLITLLSSGDNNTENKKNIKSFLEIVKQSNLNSDDIIAGMKKVAQKESSGLFKRVGNVFKTLFKEGFEEAWDLAKSEQVYYSSKLGSNMNEIREERKDFSSDGLANIADFITQTPDVKEETMHFVEKENTNGNKLYTENDVISVTDIFSENPDIANEFTSNVVELEVIKNKNNTIKYSGSTIINVGKKMTNNEALSSTILNTAYKSDMTDEYLVGITDNLVINPEMKNALDIFLNLKDKDGKDRFSANNIYQQSTYLKDKDVNTIANYTDETLYLSKFDKLNGDNIVSISNNVTDNPEIRNSVHERLNSGLYSARDIENYANSYVPTEEISQDAPSYSTQSTSTENTYVRTNNSQNDEQQTETNETTYSTNEIEINGTQYDRKNVQQAFYRKFGAVGDKLLSKLETDPKFIETVKEYKDYPVILEAIAKNPTIVNKLLCISSGLSKKELSTIIPLCNNSENTNLIISLTEKFGATMAIRLFKTAKNSNCLDKTTEIMEKNTIDTTEKKQQLEEISIA